MITLMVDPDRFSGSAVTIEGEVYRHLFRARRADRGDLFRVVDGRGNARSATLVEAGRASAVLRLGDPLPARDPLRRVTLWAATPRPERAAWLAEKAGELGVLRLCLVELDRAPRRVAPDGLERLQRLADAGLEQSHGARRCRVEGTRRFAELLAAGGAPGEAGSEGAGERWWLDPAGRPLASMLAERPGAAGAEAAPVDLAVGPEGGFTEEERRRLDAAGWTAVALGPRTLRVETAAVLAAGLLLGR